MPESGASASEVFGMQWALRAHSVDEMPNTVPEREIGRASGPAL